jgi:hypothetical protein
LNNTYKSAAARNMQHTMTQRWATRNHCFAQGATLDETLRRDRNSHYILRLAYCRTPDLRKWLLTQVCSAVLLTCLRG